MPTQPALDALSSGEQEARVLLPEGAVARLLDPPSGCGPWPAPDDPGVALAVFHAAGSGLARMLAVSVQDGALRAKVAELSGLDPHQPHTLHPRSGGLGARDERGGYHHAECHGSGESSLHPENFDSVAPPGDPIARWRRESVSPDGRGVAALEDGEAEDALWTWRVGRRAPARAGLGAFVPEAEEVSGPLLRLAEPRGVAWSPDGRWLAVADTWGLLLLERGRPARRLLHGDARCVSWCSDGRLASGGDDRALRVWDPHAKRPLLHALEGHTERILALSWSADGRLASGGWDWDVRVWDPRAATPLLHTLEHAAPVGAVAWGPDGRLAAGSHDGVVQVWGPEPDAPLLRTLEAHSSVVNALSWSWDGRLASASDDGTVAVWDPRAQAPLLQSSRGHTCSVLSVSWSSSGQLASGSLDGALIVWDPSAQAPRLSTLEGHGDAVLALSWSSSGRLASASDDGAVRVWAPQAREACLFTLQGQRGQVRALSWSGDGRLASESDGDVAVWDPCASSGPLTTLESIPSSLSAVSWCRDGRLVVGGLDGAVRVWDPRAKAPLPLTLQGQAASILALAGDSGARFASGGNDGAVTVWDLHAEPPLLRTLEGHAESALAVAWAADGRLASAGRDNTVRIWDPGAETPLLRALEGHAFWVGALSWSADGRLASGSCDHSVRIWDPDAEAPLLHTLKGHTTPVLALSWSADGRLATGGDDGVRVGAGEGSGRDLGLGKTAALAWSPDGMLAVATGPEPRCWSVGADTARRCLPLPSCLVWQGESVALSSPAQRAKAAPDALALLLHTDWAAVMPTLEGVYGAGDGSRGLERAARVAGRVAARDRGWLHLWRGGSPSMAGWIGSVAATQALLRWTPRTGGSQLQGAHFQEVEVWLPAEPATDVSPADDLFPACTSQDDWSIESLRPLCRLGAVTADLRLPDGGWLIGDAEGALALVTPDLSLALRLRVARRGEALRAPVRGLGLKAGRAVVWLEGEAGPFQIELPLFKL